MQDASACRVLRARPKKIGQQRLTFFFEEVLARRREVAEGAVVVERAGVRVVVDEVCDSAGDTHRIAEVFRVWP